MGWNLKEMTVPALKDLLSMTECALRRAEIDDDMNDFDRYKRLLQRKKDIEAELNARDKE